MKKHHLGWWLVIGPTSSDWWLTPKIQIRATLIFSIILVYCSSKKEIFLFDSHSLFLVSQSSACMWRNHYQGPSKQRKQWVIHPVASFNTVFSFTFCLLVQWLLWAELTQVTNCKSVLTGNMGQHSSCTKDSAVILQGCKAAMMSWLFERLTLPGTCPSLYITTIYYSQVFQLLITPASIK